MKTEEEIKKLKELLEDKTRQRDALDEEIYSLENKIWYLEHPETTYS